MEESSMPMAIGIFIFILGKTVDLFKYCALKIF